MITLSADNGSQTKNEGRAASAAITAERFDL